MADWDKIKNEYITTNISQRAISQKYGVSFNTLKERAAKEQWAQQRPNAPQKTRKPPQKYKPNWIKIRNEYISTNISQREIAKKYHVSINTLICRANKEEWGRHKREQVAEVTKRTQQLAAERLANKEVNRIERINNAPDRLLQKIEEATEELDRVMLKSRTRTKKSQQVEDKYIEKVIEDEDIRYKKGVVSKKALKQLTSALKDIKEITANETIGKVEVDKDPITRALEELANGDK